MRYLALCVLALALILPLALRERLPPLLSYIGYVNLLYPPHPVALALNPPQLAFTEKLRASAAAIREEFKLRREQTLRPRGEYTSEDYPGASPGEQERDNWQSIYLRTGNIDTCMTRFFPVTTAVLDSLGTRVHTAFFSELLPDRKYIAPHCGQLRGLFRVIVVLDGEKPAGAASIASFGVYHDHDMCLTRFGAQCPANITDAAAGGGKVEVVDYNVGDVILFNDFCCHWVENHATTPRLALIFNTDRDDFSDLRNTLTALGSRLFARKKLKVFREASERVCNALDAAGDA
jgi:hypothetical protein